MDINGVDIEKVEAEYNFKKWEGSSKELEVLSLLPINDRRMLIMYAELRSLRKMAKIYSVDKMTMYKYVTKAKNKYKQLYKNY